MRPGEVPPRWGGASRGRPVGKQPLKGWLPWHPRPPAGLSGEKGARFRVPSCSGLRSAANAGSSRTAQRRAPAPGRSPLGPAARPSARSPSSNLRARWAPPVAQHPWAEWRARVTSAPNPRPLLSLLRPLCQEPRAGPEETRAPRSQMLRHLHQHRSGSPTTWGKVLFQTQVQCAISKAPK